MKSRKLLAILLTVTFMLSNFGAAINIRATEVDPSDQISVEAEEIEDSEALGDEPDTQIGEVQPGEVAEPTDQDAPVLEDQPQDPEQTTPVDPSTPEDPVEPEQVIKPEADTITLTFDSQGGPEVDPIILDKGAVLFELPKPDDHPGFEFLGWVDQNGEPVELPLALDLDTTIYAAWADLADEQADEQNNPDSSTSDYSTTPYAGIDYNVYPETSFSLSPATIPPPVRFPGETTPPVIGEDHPAKPGEVMLFKQEEPVAGKVNTWKITLRVEGRRKYKTTDVILVMDTSKSMGLLKLGDAKIAAKNFVDTLLADDRKGETRIGIVAFSDTQEVKQALTKEKATLNQAIENLYPNNAEEGAFTQAGIKQAQVMLDNSYNALSSEQKKTHQQHIVLMSQGVPTYSYKIINESPRYQYCTEYVDGVEYDGYWGVATYTGRGLATNTLIPEANFDYSKTAGYGKNMYTSRRILLNKHLYSHGNSAIAQAGFAKGQLGDKGKLWAIDFSDSNGPGEEINKQIASPGCNYKHTQTETAITAIAENMILAFNGATITDPMGPGFNILEGTQITSNPTTAPTPTYGNNTITWNIGNIENILAGTDDEIDYAEITYTIEINEDILGATPNKEGKYPTNGDAKISYEDVYGDPQKKPFPVPTVKPVLYTVEKILKDKDGKPKTADRDFAIEVTGPEGSNYKKEITLNASAEETTKKTITDLRVPGEYTVAEVNATEEDYDYEETYKVNNVDGTSNFNVDKDKADLDQVETIEVQVINKEKPGKLTIEKVFDQTTLPPPPKALQQLMLKTGAPISRANIGPVSFSFTIQGPDNYSAQFTLPEDGNWEKVYTDLAYGTYTVTEGANDYITTVSVDKATATEGKSATLDIGLDGDAKRERTVTITNQVKEENQMTLTAKKVWEGGPKPQIWFQLVRVANDDAQTELNIGAPRPVSADTNSVTWQQTDSDEIKKVFVKYDENGKVYTYKVKEVNADGDDFVPPNYTPSFDQGTLTVTNTYEVPTAGEHTARKVWDGAAEVTRPTMTFTLWRKTETGTDEQVPVDEADVKEITGTVLEATWTGLEETDIDGNSYTFYVEEAFKDETVVENDNWTLGGYDEGKDSITNTVKTGEDNLGKLTVKKVLDNETTENQHPKSAAFRSVPEPQEFSFTVTGPYGYSETFTLTAGASKELTSLYFGEYTVEEDEVEGFAASYAPGNSVTLTDADKEKTVTVTNTNDGGNVANVTKTVTKEWVNGPKPETVIELWRKGLAVDGTAIDEKVNEFTADGNKTFETFTKKSDGVTMLAKLDPSGREFEYYAKEPNAPDNYTKQEEGLTVTNIYEVPTAGEHTARKVWDGAAEVTRPTMTFTLWRKTAGGDGEEVPGAEVKDIDGDNTTATWTGLEETDIDGNSYTFYVEEAFKDETVVENDNWTLGGYDEGKDSITNTVKTGEDNLGKLTVTKVLVNETPKQPTVMAFRSVPAEPQKFSFTVTGPYGYSETFTLTAGASKELTSLYFGEYTVEEEEVEGFTASYAPGNSVTLTDADKEKTVTVTNTNYGGNVVNVTKTVTKEWVNGPKPDTVIELWRKGLAVDGTAIDEKVNEFTADGNKTFETFTKKSDGVTMLAKLDPSGREFEYYIKEPKVPANYTASFDQETLTVTNTYKKTPGDGTDDEPGTPIYITTPPQVTPPQATLQTSPPIVSRVPKTGEGRPDREIQVLLLSLAAVFLALRLYKRK